MGALVFQVPQANGYLLVIDYFIRNEASPNNATGGTFVIAWDNVTYGINSNSIVNVGNINYLAFMYLNATNDGTNINLYVLLSDDNHDGTYTETYSVILNARLTQS